MQISHRNLANIFFSDHTLFFVQAFSTMLLNKKEKQTNATWDKMTIWR